MNPAHCFYFYWTLMDLTHPLSIFRKMHRDPRRPDQLAKPSARLLEHEERCLL